MTNDSPIGAKLFHLPGAGIKRERWIDVLKGIAILAVVLDHTFLLFPKVRVEILWQHTYFSITWFVFLSGVTNTLSAKRKNKWQFPWAYLSFWKKRSKILIPYFFASLVAYLTLNFKQINLADFLKGVLYFSHQPTFYFINLICQLYLIFPFLYSLLCLCRKHWQKFILTIAVFIFSFILLPVKYPIWPFSPAGRLFGSAFLAAFFLGILFGQKEIVDNDLMIKICFFAFVILEGLLIYTKGSFASIVPSFYLVVWSLSLLFLVKKIISGINGKSPIFTLLAFIGRGTLFIYLFHFLFLTILARLPFWDFRPGVLVVYLAAVFLSIAVKIVYERVFGLV